MEETDLKQVLKECNKSAKTGYKIASAQEKNLNIAIFDWNKCYKCFVSVFDKEEKV